MDWSNLRMIDATEQSLAALKTQPNAAVRKALLILAEVIDSTAPIEERIPAYDGHGAIMDALLAMENAPEDELARARERRGKQ